MVEGGEALLRRGGELVRLVESSGEFPVMVADGENRPMLIGEFAAELGTSARMLRHYEDTGLLAPAGRDGNGYRVYAAEQLPRTRQIKGLIDAGVPTALVAQLIDALTDSGGIFPEHVDPGTVEAVESEWQRMCHCVDCMVARRDALGAYLGALKGE
ncbi:MerR family transcriptional regulator [Enemella evansiae]|uniref:MerR family transcriptional regulator n=2 Tax=Enemella evansiae TaxID=2016499 RepID=A0A255GIX6_9ACTN|nr:MerR family transcriptional regulator [Enemella evansiae]